MCFLLFFLLHKINVGEGRYETEDSFKEKKKKD